MAEVVLIDNDQDLLDALVDLVATLNGGSCLAARSLDELQAAAPRALACRLAIVDLNLGRDKPTGIDVLLWLQAQRFRGRIVFLTAYGEADVLVKSARRLGLAQIFRKPTELGALSELIKRETAISRTSN
jgi:FixJ family two-component response regulator